MNVIFGLLYSLRIVQEMAVHSEWIWLRLSWLAFHGKTRNERQIPIPATIEL
jgi:hypothetical protein